MPRRWRGSLLVPINGVCLFWVICRCGWRGLARFWAVQ